MEKPSKNFIYAPQKIKDYGLGREVNLNLVNEAYKLRLTDRIKSFLILEEFAANGSKASLVYISDMFRRGVDIDNIVEKAKHWSAIARNLHMGELSYNFGVGFYNLGNYASAFEAFSWGTEDGYAPSIYRLASMYYFGKYVQKDYHKSRYFLEMSSKKGNLIARKNLVHLLLFRNVGLTAKIKGLFMLFSIIYYQFYIIFLVLRKIPYDERFYG